MSHRQKLHIIDTVACPYCGASIGALCRNARTGEPLPMIRGRHRGPALNVCKARRKAFEEGNGAPRMANHNGAPLTVKGG